MSLSPGQSLTFYEILDPLGAGGMGEVWRARDTRLEREVAIKVLPEDLADDEDRLRRFEREAKTLASINHSNIAGIHGVDQQGDVCFLALELVPGEDLAARLARGPLPVKEAIEVCRQIATGLEAAHEAGVVHRDLKPANVRITPEGTVKLLDFGLAKPTRAKEATSGSTAESDSFLMTAEGVVLGTPTYMSPEQARGKRVDRRTDIWAFGCVLYECLTGKRAFGGESMTDVLASIVGDEPDWSALPPLPARLGELLHRCLTKDPRQRLRDAGEARVQLELAKAEPASAGSGEETAAAEQGGSGLKILLAGILGLLLGSALGRLLGPRTMPEVAPDGPARHIQVVLETLEAGAGYPPDLALSPDGTYIAWTQREGIYVRPLGSLNAVRIPIGESRGDSEGPDRDELPRVITWSPDSREIAYKSKEAFWRVPRGGGPAILIERDEDAPEYIQDLVWTADGRLVFADGDNADLRSIPVQGGDIATLLAADEETLHYDGVCSLPDGDLLVVRHPVDGTPDTFAVLRNGELRDVHRIPGWRMGSIHYATGRIVFERSDEGQTSLWSVAFSPEAGAFRGEPIMLVDSGKAVTAAGDGTVAYLRQQGKTLCQPVWVDLEGAVEPFGRALDSEFIWPVATTDGRQVITAQPLSETLWSYDIERRTFARALKHELGGSMGGTLPDGRLYISSFEKQETYVVPKRGRGEPELLSRGFLRSVTSDGSRGLVVTMEGREGPMLNFLDMQSGDLSPVQETLGQGGAATISPDDRWFLYASDRTGDTQIYLSNFPSGTEEWPVSTSGGMFAWFDASGETIYFIRGILMTGDSSEVWKVSLQTDPEVRLGIPEKVFDLEGQDVQVTDFHRGQERFLGFRRLDPSSQQIVVDTGGTAGR